jgi:hypothetical protein
MKFLKKLTILTAILLFSSILAKAEVKIAFCQFEAGCKFYQTSLTYKQVDGLLGYLGVYEKDKGIMVFFRNKQNQDVHYPDQKRSPKELHQYFGGKGEPTTAKGDVLPFTNIQPKDGNWLAVTETPIAKGCPAQLQEQLGEIASIKSGNRTFKKPFTPDELLPPDTTWINTATNSFKAVILPATKPAFTSIYDFEIVSPTLVKGILTINVQIPNQPTCEIKTNFTFTHSN